VGFNGERRQKLERPDTKLDPGGSANTNN